MDKDTAHLLAQIMMKDEDLRKLAEGQVETLKEITKKGTDALLPVMAVTCVNSKTRERSVSMVALADLPDKSEGRHEAMQKVAAIFAAKHEIPVGVSFASEAWMKKLSIAEAHRARHGGFPEPSKCPDRQEIAQVSAMSMSRFSVSFLAPISRDKDNRIILGKFEGGPGDARCFLLESFFGGVLGQLMKNLKS
jgi:hypothetical protein